MWVTYLEFNPILLNFNLVTTAELHSKARSVKPVTASRTSNTSDLPRMSIDDSEPSRSISDQPFWFDSTFIPSACRGPLHQVQPLLPQKFIPAMAHLWIWWPKMMIILVNYPEIVTVPVAENRCLPIWFKSSPLDFFPTPIFYAIWTSILFLKPQGPEKNAHFASLSQFLVF